MFGEKGYVKLVKHILKNGAKELQVNETTQNFEYKIL